MVIFLHFIGVYIYMHFYACPYCPPDDGARLTVEQQMDVSCGHKKTGLFKNKDGECEADEYKCKQVMRCAKCNSEFKMEEEFLREQKRKIKDG